MASIYSQETVGTARLETENILAEFWQQWLDRRDELYKCCLYFLKNPTDAEDALGRAMLKAWEKIQKYAGKITNIKSWLKQLTCNLCKDIIRERSRGAAGVESIEWVGATEAIATTTVVETPELALEREEKQTEIRRAVADLPQTLRDSFVLHFYRELSHEEIAREQGISYDTVCKRISRARKKLKEKLSAYVRGGEVADTSPEPASKAKQSKQPKPEESRQKQEAQESPTPEEPPQPPLKKPLKKGETHPPEIIPESKEIERESREAIAKVNTKTENLQATEV